LIVFQDFKRPIIPQLHNAGHSGYGVNW